METTKQNDKSKNIPKMTAIVTELYIALASLEKKGQENKADYKNILSLLRCSIQYEEKDYQNYQLSNKDKEIIFAYYNKKNKYRGFFSPTWL